LGKNQAINASGCGLGLALSNSIVALLYPFPNSKIEVVSEENSGSEFSFFISPLLDLQFHNKDE
jgi:hypothetical protein